MKEHNNIYLSLGSNIGNRIKNIENAIKEIKKNNITIIANSSIYETEAIGFREQRDFINLVLKIFTKESPDKLLMLLKKIERNMGRKKTFKWGPRIIDIDILLYNDIIINKKNLHIPHREIVNRYFILIMLKEIEDIKLPDIELTISEVLEMNTYTKRLKKVKFVNFT